MKVDVSELIKKSVIIMPEIKVWTGQSKLSVSDFPASVQDALPPEDLARLGSKQLLPKDYLRDVELSCTGGDALPRRVPCTGEPS